jgi:hypothetical protein
MEGLEQIIALLEDNDIVAELWVDGSFLTQKIDPVDSDVVLCIPNHVYDDGKPEQRNVIDFIYANLKNVFLCDSYVLFDYPRSHPLFHQGQDARAYWTNQFGRSRGNQAKGIAVIKVGECL